MKERIKGIVGLLQTKQISLDECVDKIDLLYNPEKESMEVRKQLFIDTVKPFVDMYGKQMCNEFVAKFTEPVVKGRNKGKMKFELEKTWSLHGRLSTWYRNSKKFELARLINKTK